jgi:hypothetical protein
MAKNPPQIPITYGLESFRHVLYSSFIAELGDETAHNKSVTKTGYPGLDEVQSYTYNSSGYRSPEFSDGIDLLCAGDSHTFGVGLPLEGTWPKILSEKLKIPYANLGRPGGSIQSIIFDVFHFIRTYGAPKYLLISFPEIDRFMFYSEPKLLVSETDVTHKGPRNTQLGHRRPINERPRVSKKPHKVEDVIPIHHVLMTSIQSIHALEDFCDAMGITLYWSFWDNFEQNNLIKNLKGKNEKYYRHYIDGLIRNWQRDRETKISNYAVNDEVVECHLDIKKTYPETFNFASDMYPHHDGVHRHVHLAEIFEQLIAKR